MGASWQWSFGHIGLLFKKKFKLEIIESRHLRDDINIKPGLLGSSVVRNLPTSAGDRSLMPGLGRFYML